MIQRITSNNFPWAILAILLSIGPWAMLWLNLGPGEPEGLLYPDPKAFVQGMFAVSAVAAAGVATIIVGVKVARGIPRSFGFFGPLGLATVYGLAGLAASIKSPDGSLALWSAAIYLSVPIVLWGTVWGGAPLDRLRRLVNATWLVMIVASTVLFLLAVLYLDLVDRTLHPTQLLECRQTYWVELTGGRLRGTGVGRYAAIAGLIAISGLWQARWRPLWLIGLLTSVTLLVYTGARESFGGFLAGAAVIVLSYLVYSGKRALLSALLVALVLVPLVWSTGAHRTFLGNCVLRGAMFDPLEVAEPADPGQTVIDATTGEDSNSGLATLREPTDRVESILISEDFLKFSGRTTVWMDGWRLFKASPVIGYGFQADRLMLGTHMHNSVLHALLQTGLIGAIPFVTAIIFAWILFFRIILRLTRLPSSHKHLVIQCGGVLAFLTMRSLPESTGAFFGVDWLLRAPILFYLQLVNDRRHQPP